MFAFSISAVTTVLTHTPLHLSQLINEQPATRVTSLICFVEQPNDVFTNLAVYIEFTITIRLLLSFELPANPTKLKFGWHRLHVKSSYCFNIFLVTKP